MSGKKGWGMGCSSQFKWILFLKHIPQTRSSGQIHLTKDAERGLDVHPANILHCFKNHFGSWTGLPLQYQQHECSFILTNDLASVHLIKIVSRSRKKNALKKQQLNLEKTLGLWISGSVCIGWRRVVFIHPCSVRLQQRHCLGHSTSSPHNICHTKDQNDLQKTEKAFLNGNLEHPAPSQ